MIFWILILFLIAVAIFVAGIRIVEPMEKGLIERLGDYHKFALSGFNWIIPLVDKMRKINISEMMVDAQPQLVMTKDRLNAKVSAQIYIKVRDDEKSVKASQYNAYDYYSQITSLARTTLRKIIGDMTLEDANTNRNAINSQLMTILTTEANNWGIDVVRAELKEIDPPEDVQESMNQVIKAENEKKAAVDRATARETEADGERRAAIKKSEGLKQSFILEAQGKAESVKIEADARAEAIKKVNESAQKYFKAQAVELKRLEVLQASLEKNSKIVVVKDGINPSIILGEGSIIPVRQTT